MNKVWVTLLIIEFIVSFLPAAILLYLGILHALPAVIMLLTGNFENLSIIILTVLGCFGCWGMIQIFSSTIFIDVEIERPIRTIVYLACGFAALIYLSSKSSLKSETIFDFPAMIFVLPIMVALHFIYLSRKKLWKDS